jgi:alpha-D-ribose 1-methylphosphonate 5-triphosphate synthase subunit PhnI
LGALAIKQAQGDLVEAVFLLRAYRTTLPRFGYSSAIDTSRMTIQRRISAAYKDLPGGQVLGATYDYTHRLLDFSLAAKQLETEGEEADISDDAADTDTHPDTPAPDTASPPLPRIASLLAAEGMIEPEEPDAGDGACVDITREPLQVPALRGTRLQNLFRGDEGFLLGMGYSTQRGFGAGVHPFMGEIRYGTVEVTMIPEELGFDVTIGEIEVTECVMLHRFSGNAHQPPQFIKGYGIAFGRCERKAMAMALVDRSLRSRELGEMVDYPAQNEEFVLYHSDNVEASGFVQHLKLPHYVDFQADLVLMRTMMADHQKKQYTAEENQRDADQTSHAA